MQPKLDTSVPKDQIAAIVGSMFVGAVASTVTLFYALGSPSLNVFTISYAFLGAMMGTFGISVRVFRRGWINFAMFTIVAAILSKNIPMLRDIVMFGAVSWAVSFVLMSSYHFIQFRRND